MNATISWVINSCIARVRIKLPSDAYSATYDEVRIGKRMDVFVVKGALKQTMRKKI